MRKFSLLVFMLFIASLSWAQEGSLDTLIDQQKVEEVTIYASRTNAKLKDLPTKTEVILCKEIKQSGAKDLAYLLKSNSSIDLIQYPGFLSGIGMRGFAPGTNNKYIQVFINGIPSGTSNMATLSLSGIKQVEILKGPFSSLYGSKAMGGVINLVPNRNTGKITGNVSANYGSYKSTNISAAVGGKIVGGLSFDLDAFYHMQDEDYKIGNKNIYGNKEKYETILDKQSFGATKINTTEKSFGGNLRLGYDFNKNWSLDIYGNYFATDDLATGGDVWSTYGPSFKDMELYGTHLSLKGKINQHTVTFNPYYSNEYNGYLDTETKKATYESILKTYGFQLQDNLTIGNIYNLTFGLDNKQSNKQVKSATKDGVAKAPSSPGYTNGTFGLFAQCVAKVLNDKVNFSAGIRYDIMSFTLKADDFLKNEEKTVNDGSLNPNLGIRFNIDKHNNIHASFGTAFLAPSAFQMAGRYEKTNWQGKQEITIGNPDLNPETSVTFDIGYGYKNIPLGINLDVTYFNTNHKDFINSYKKTIDDNTIHKLFKNSEKAKMNGIELMASYDLGSLFDYNFSLKAYFNGTFMLKSEELSTNFITKEGEWIDMEYVRQQNSNFGLQFSLPNKFDIKLNGRYLGARFETVWSGQDRELGPYKNKQGKLRAPEFMVFDANAYYHINRNFTVGINANNILDENYTEKDGYNMPGRSFMGTVRFNF